MTIGLENGSPYAGEDNLDDSVTLTPDVSVVPAVAAQPTGNEIKIPFQIDPATGGVAFLSNYYDILRQHIVTILLTVIGERLMLPNYGSDAQNHVFAPIGQVGNLTFADDLQKAVSRWEPAITVTRCSVGQDPTQLSALLVEVDYTVVPFSDSSSLVLSTGGGVVQVISP